MTTDPTPSEMTPWTPRKRYLTRDQAAEVLHLQPRTLENWQYARKGPPVTRVGARTLYDEELLYAWLETQTITEITHASGL